MLSSFIARPQAAALSLLALFALTRIYPLVSRDPATDYEVLSAQKLGEYGFVARHGVPLEPPYSHGRLAEPERFNYSHHPLLFFWGLVGMYVFGGAWAVCLTVTALAGLATLAGFGALRTQFGARNGWVAAALFSVSPLFLFSSTTAQPAPLSACLWPVGWWLALRAQQPLASPCRYAWWLGVVVFVACQMTWFALSVVPALLALTACPEESWRKVLQRSLRSPLWWGILIGAGTSLTLFVAQVLVYEPSLQEAWGYARIMSGGTTTVQHLPTARSRMLLALPVRMTVLVGPAVVVAAAMALWRGWRQRWRPPVVVWIGLAYLAGFAAVAVAAPFFFVREQWVYAYALFPLVCVAAWGWDQNTSRIWRGTILGLALAGICYVYVRASLPAVSEASRAIGDMLAAHTRPEDVIVSNLQSQRWPFPAWESSGSDSVAGRADRILLANVRDRDGVERVRHRFGPMPPPMMYLKLATVSLSPDLDSWLAEHGQIIWSGTISLPPEKETWGLKLRSWYWRIQGKTVPTTTIPDGGASGALFEIYRLSPSAL